MYGFEAEILSWLSEWKVTGNVDEDSHLLNTNVVTIRCIPNLSGSADLDGFNHNVAPTITIWEDIFLQKKEIVKSILQSQFRQTDRILARKTTVATLSQDEMDTFLDDNHLLGKVKAKHRLGLMQNGALVAVMSFGRACPIQYRGKTYRSHEVIRYCSLKGITVVGGLTKLLAHFVRKYKPEHLMTYVDKEWSDGVSFKKAGFMLVGQTEPESFWLFLEDGKRYREFDRILHKNVSADRWQEVRNKGNLKFIKLITDARHG